MAFSFKKEVEREIALICEAIGFKKKKFSFVKPINNNVWGTIGLTTSTHGKKDHLYINPIVGVIYEDVEKVYANLTGYNKLDIMQNTIGIPIGYLMPENKFKEWEFIEGSQNNKIVLDEMFSALKRYGFTYHEKMKNFENLFDAIENRMPGVLNEARDRYLPILYYLKGEKQKGVAVIEKSIELQKQPKSLNDLPKFENQERVTVMGDGYNGRIDPEYLKFGDKYKAL